MTTQSVAAAPIPPQPSMAAPPAAAARPGSVLVRSTTDAWEIAIDPSRRHLRIAAIGLWDEATTAGLGPVLAAAIGDLLKAGVAWGSLRTMVDVRRAAIMPQALVALLEGYVAEHGPASERLAFLCGGMIQKMQYQRIAPGETTNHFLDEAAAHEWLFA